MIALAHQDGDHLGSDSLSWNAVGRVHVHCLVVLFLCHCDIFPIRIALCTEGGGVVKYDRSICSSVES